MTTTTTPTSGAADLPAMVSKALREAYNLGQRYWQQADSEYISQHKKADDTRAKFLTLVEETCAALAAGQATAAPAQPAAQQGAAYAGMGHTDGGRNMFYEGRFDGESQREQQARLRWANDMRAAFERHTGNGWFDKDWRTETGLWSSAWYACLAAQPTTTAQSADSVQEDAARYRWLREGNDAKHSAAWHVAVNLYGCEWDAAIDAARKQGASHDR